VKQHFIAFLKTDEEITDFFLVRSVAIKIGSNKKQYLDLFLADKTGEISAKKWDIADTELTSLNEIKEGEYIKVKANVINYNGMKQFKIIRLRKAGPQDQDKLERADFVKSAPERGEDMYTYILKAATEIDDEDLKNIAIKLLEDNREKLLYYPAAAKNHHAELAGLLYHMKRMLMMTRRYCQVYAGLNPDLLITGVIVHDIEKLTEMVADEDGVVSEYSFEGKLLGHLISGVKVVDRLAQELNVPEEKAIMLEHMIISHHYEPEFGSPKKPMFPEAELLHYLDIVDARLYDMEDALQGVSKGSFSDKVRTLDFRMLYKPSLL
jgi:3'-5' exoribonuclease